MEQGSIEVVGKGLRSSLHHSKPSTLHSQAKRHPEHLRVPFVKRALYLAPRIASLAALATRNLTTRLAGIWICSPVAGLRPMRAARLTRTSLPRPGSVKVFLACLYAKLAMLSRISVACFLVSWFFSAIAAATCDLESAFAIVLMCFVVVWSKLQVVRLGPY